MRTEVVSIQESEIIGVSKSFSTSQIELQMVKLMVDADLGE